MSPAKLSALARRLRAERGQTSVEYVGVFLVACAIVAVLLSAGIDELLAAKLKAQIVAVTTDQESGGGGSSRDSSGGSGDTEGGATGGDPGREGSGSGGDAGGETGPGGTDLPGGTSPPGNEGSVPGEAPGAGSGAPPGTATPGAGPGGEPAAEGEPSRWPCLSATAGGIQGCAAAALGVPAYLAEKGKTDARAQLKRAEARVQATPKGSAERAAAIEKRNRAGQAYDRAKARATLPGVAAADRARKWVNGTVDDVERAREAPQNDRQRIAAQDLEEKKLQAKQQSRGAAGRFAGDAQRVGGKILKGTGVVGTALGGVSDVEKDGLAKGGTKTAGAVAGAWAGGAAVAAGCAAAAVVTAGVGGVLCGVAVVGASVIGSQVGKELSGFVYDKALAPVGRAAGELAEKYVPGAKAVGDGLAEIDDGAKKVAKAINPTNWF
jgi:hypothetical protein